MNAQQKSRYDHLPGAFRIFEKALKPECLTSQLQKGPKTKYFVDFYLKA